MTNTERLIAALFYAEQAKRHSEDQPWRPNQIVGRFTPSAALVANNAIGRMMR